MKITKRQLIQIIKEELEDTMEEGWWPFGKGDDEEPASSNAASREFLKQHRVKKAAKAAAAKKAKLQAAWDEKQKKRKEAEEDAAVTDLIMKRERGAKRKEDEKNKIEHWEYDTGRGSMAVQVNNPESVAEFHRANGSEIPEWVLKALNKSRF